MRDHKPSSDLEMSRGHQFSRRGLIRSAAGAAGTGLVLGSGLAKPLLADSDEDGRVPRNILPLPIRYISPASHLHAFFPGPVEGTAIATDPTGAQANGRDPSTITNFNGLLGQADINFSGTGTDLITGAQSPYDFHADIRFLQGTFIGSDERRHHGSFSFLWIDSILPAPAGRNQFGPHSYDPGVSRTLMAWTVEIPDESVEIILEAGEAILQFRNLRTVFDAFSIANSLSPDRPLGLVGAAIHSLRMHWTGIQRTVSFSNATTGFSGDYVENSAVTIALTVATPSTNPPFTPAPQNAFRFVSDPTTTVMNFAQLGRERNGSFFPG